VGGSALRISQRGTADQGQRCAASPRCRSSAALWQPDRLRPDDQVLEELLALGPEPSEDQVRRVLAESFEAWRTKPKHATAFLSGVAKSRHPAVARTVLSSMLASGVEANVFHYTAVISACEKAGQWQLALSLLDSMRRTKLPPNAISYSAAVSACGRGSRWQAALKLLSSMPEASLAPNDFTYNAAITACEKAGQWQIALGLLQTMPEMRVVPNAISCNAAISACEKGGKWQLALSIFASMPKITASPQASPDKFSFSAAISAKGSGNLRSACFIKCQRQAWCQLKRGAKCSGLQCGNQRLRERVAACAGAFAEAGQWQMAVALLARMPKVGLNPNVISYNAAICACERGLQWESVLDLTRQMSAARVAMNTATHTAALMTFSSAGRWQEALSLGPGGSPRAADLGRSCGTLLMECEQRDLLAVEVSLTDRLSAAAREGRELPADL
ncbi:unnamed protein product, partial [Polarella glacialis]